MKTILKRLKQESTWRGLITVLAAFGIVMKPELSDAIIAAGIGIAGLINILKKD